MKLFSSTSRPRSWTAAAITLLLGSRLAAGIELDVHDPDSIMNAARIAAKGLISYYSGEDYGQTPGLLPQPYYWWEGGAMWMTLIDYWWYTGDSQYNDLITKGIQWQTGPGANFIDYNQSYDNGNDDQAFWAFAAMDAAELQFPNPPKDQPQWLALAQAVYNVQLTRFTKVCGGGLPWQVETFSPGYYYKNTISNGCFFALAARLARYTGNATYAHYAETTYDWVVQAGLINDQTYEIWDGVDTSENCTINGIQWTYNHGVFLEGAAYMWSFTKKDIWRKRIDGIIDGLHVFFEHGVMYEQWCEGSTQHPCNNDQQSFKGYLARWMAVTTELCPWTYHRLMPLLKKSAKAAAAQCTGGDSGTECGLQWTINGTTGHFDGIVGPGEQIAALSVFGSLLTPSPKERKHPKNKHQKHLSQGPVNHVLGHSKGDPGAGLNMTALHPPENLGILSVTTGDRVGSWLLTVILALVTLGGAVWAIRDDGKPFTYLAKSPRRSPKPKSWKEKSNQWPSPSINSPKMRQSQINSPQRVLHSKYGTPGVSSPVVAVASPAVSIPPASKRTSLNSKRLSDKPTPLRQPPPSPV